MKNKIMILIGFLIICMTLGLIGNTGYVQVKKDDTAKKENEQSNELKSSTYSGISVGDKWTMGNKDPNDGIDTQNISYEITSISGDSLLADIYVDGIVIYSSGHIEGAVLTDDWISTHINLPWTITYSDTYGGRTLTVCDTQESFGAWKIFDISTGIVVETDFDILTSWDIYEAPPPPLPPYSGVSVGDTWTYEYFFGNVSFEITSVSFPSVWANEYWDGVYERETDVAIAYVL